MFTRLRRLFRRERSCRFCDKPVPRKMNAEFCSAECQDRWDYWQVL